MVTTLRRGKEVKEEMRRYKTLEQVKYELANPRPKYEKAGERIALFLVITWFLGGLLVLGLIALIVLALVGV